MTKIIAAADTGRSNADIAEVHDPRLRLILAASFLAGFIALIAAGTTFRNAHRHTPVVSTASNFDDRGTALKKGDRLALPAQVPFPMATPLTTSPSEGVPSPVEMPKSVEAPHQQLPLATEEDMRQAKSAHQRHHDICPHGRTYFTIEHHRYWRCVR